MAFKQIIGASVRRGCDESKLPQRESLLPINQNELPNRSNVTLKKRSNQSSLSIPMNGIDLAKDCMLNTVSARDRSRFINCVIGQVSVSMAGANFSNCRCDDVNTRDNISIENASIGSVKSSMGAATLTDSIVNYVRTREKCTVINSTIKSVDSMTNNTEVTQSNVNVIRARDNIIVRDSETIDCNSIMGGIKMVNSSAKTINCRDGVVLTNSSVDSCKSTMGKIDAKNVNAGSLNCRDNISAVGSSLGNIETSMGSCELTDCVGKKAETCITYVRARDDITMNRTNALKVTSLMGSLVWRQYFSEQKTQPNVDCRDNLLLEKIAVDSAKCGGDCTLLSASVNDLAVIVCDLDRTYTLNMKQSIVSKITVQYEPSQFISVKNIITIPLRSIVGYFGSLIGYNNNESHADGNNVSYAHADNNHYPSVSAIPNQIQNAVLNNLLSNPGKYATVNKLKLKVVNDQLVEVQSPSFVPSKSHQNLVKFNIVACPDSKFAEPVFVNCTTDNLSTY